MAVLAQLMDIENLQNLSAEQLRELILGLHSQIQHGKDERLLVSLEATVVGVRNDIPAGPGDPVVRPTKR